MRGNFLGRIKLYFRPRVQTRKIQLKIHKKKRIEGRKVYNMISEEKITNKI